MNNIDWKGVIGVLVGVVGFFVVSAIVGAVFHGCRYTGKF